MSTYRRWYQPGGTSFFTIITYGRFPLFEDEAPRNLLGDVMRIVRSEMPFETVAIVLLPDHLHAVWTLPPGEEDFSTRWKMIKGQFTERWLAAGGSERKVTRSQARRGNRGIWQRRFIEHLIRDENDLERHCPWDHAESSFRRFVSQGQYEWDWGRTKPESIAGLDYELYDDEE